MSFQTAKSVARIQHSPSQHPQKDRREGATFERAGIGIVEIDRDGAILRANRYFRDYLHCPVDGITGRSVFEFMHPADAHTDREQLRDQVDNAFDGYTLEGRLQLQNGQTRWVSISSTCVCDQEGRFLYAVRVYQDITERKRFEENLAIYSTDQEVLHHLSARVQRAGSVDDICSATMDAMSRSLGCARASVLLLDEHGQMRFVAARGLSPAYMAAVEGHSPWAADARDAQSVCIGNVRDYELAADLKKTVLAEGIEALAFIPLLDARRLLGKFMVYYDEPHPFSARENEMAGTIARHVSFGLERLKSQRAARHLAAIVESSTDAIVSKNLDAVITSWNQGAERLFGYTAREAVGQPVTILIPPDRLDEEPAILARIRAGERVEHFETVRRHKSGRLIDISLTISPIKDDNVGAIVGASKIARDIGDQKAAQRRLQENEMRLQELLSAIPAAIYTTDAKGKITYFNEAAVEFAGRRPEIGSDQWCVSWKLFWPDGTPLPLEKCPMAICLKEGRPIRGVEAVAERPDGTRVPFIPYPTPLHDGAGNIVGAINMLVDVSQRKEAETQQRLLLNELNHRVKNNMQMLQALISRAARHAAHPEARHHLYEASSRVAAMASAQRVLYGQAGAQHFNTAELFKAVSETIRQISPRSVRVECEAEDLELPNDVAMPLALILNELMTNAVKHGSRGQDASTVRVRLGRAGEDLRLSVEDDGPGFDLEEKRGVSSGLQLVEGLTRQLGGELQISRQPTSRVSLDFALGTRP